MIYQSGILQDRIAVVTGGGTGIGKAITRALVLCGARTVIAGRRQDALDQARQEIGEDRVVAIPTNIRDAASVANLASCVRERFGRVDILVNNAGGQFVARAEAISENGWKAVIDLNLNGTFLMCKSVGELMIGERAGKIINIIANFYDSAAPGLAHSAAARAGVAGLTRTLAVEWASYGVIVNAVAVGPVETEGARGELERDTGMFEKIRKATPLGRWGSSEDVANLVVFLASDAADYITGQIITVDGGNALSGGIKWF